MFSSNILDGYFHEELYRFVWGEEPVNCRNSVMCCISQVRKKIELNSRYPKYIHTGVILAINLNYSQKIKILLGVVAIL